MKIKNLICSTLLLGVAISGLTVMSSCSSKEKTISIYTRDTTSGTRDGFFTGIGLSEAKEDNSPLKSGYIEVGSNGDMINSVKNDVNGIGYISLSSLAESGVKGLTYEGVEPTEANVLNDTYKLTRNFNYCLRESYENVTNKAICEAFVAYMSSIEGKATIKDKGGILETSSLDKSWEEVKANYEVTTQDNSSITINVGGSTSVKSIVSALLLEFSSKCGGFKYNYNPTGSGDAYKRTNGSEKDGANYCDLAFLSREFKTEEALDDSLKGKMCIDAIVAVVNNKNNVSKVSAANLRDIYTGAITKWDEVK
ncbi:MAG: substrate-binding domain-containing protein [Bacilli bacterium]